MKQSEACETRAQSAVYELTEKFVTIKKRCGSGSNVHEMVRYTDGANKETTWLVNCSLVAASDSDARARNETLQ